MCLFYLFLLSVLVHSSFGVYIDAGSSIPLYDGQQDYEYVNTNPSPAVNEEVMNSVLNVIVISLRQDLSITTKTAYLLATLKDLLKLIAANNIEVSDKIDELWHILKNSKEFRGINEDNMRILVKSNKNLQFEYKFPSFLNSYCNEAVLKIARIAYEAYEKLAHTSVCNFLEISDTPTKYPIISELPDLETINPGQTDFYKPFNTKDVIASDVTITNKETDKSGNDVTPIEFDLYPLKPITQDLITDKVKGRDVLYDYNLLYPNYQDPYYDPYNIDFGFKPSKPNHGPEKLEKLIDDRVRDREVFYETNPSLSSDLDQDYIPYSDFDLNPSNQKHKPELPQEFRNDKVNEREGNYESNPSNNWFPEYNIPIDQDIKAYPILPLNGKPSDYETNDIPEAYDITHFVNKNNSEFNIINSNDGPEYHEKPFQDEYDTYGYPLDMDPVPYDVITKPAPEIVPQNDFPDTFSKPKEVEYLRTLDLIRDAIDVIEVEIPATAFDLATLYNIAEIKDKLKKDKYIDIKEYWAIFELFMELINYIKQFHIYDQIIDRFDITRVTNPDKLETERVVELTYLVKRPTPIVYYPYYYVKYTLPYPSFVNSANSLLQPNQLRPDTEQYKRLLAHSKVVDASKDLKNYRKKDLLGLVLESGYLVNAELVGEISTLADHLNALKDITAELSAEEVLRLNNHALKKVNKLAGNTDTTSNDIETINFLNKILKENKVLQSLKSDKDLNAEISADLGTFDSDKLRNNLLRAEHVGFPYSDYSNYENLYPGNSIPEREQMSPVMYKLLMETMATSLRGKKLRNLHNSQDSINIYNQVMPLASQMRNPDSNQIIQEINNSGKVNEGQILSSPREHNQVTNKETYGQQDEDIATNDNGYGIQASNPIVARYTKIVTEHDI